VELVDAVETQPSWPVEWRPPRRTRDVLDLLDGSHARPAYATVLCHASRPEGPRRGPRCEAVSEALSATASAISWSADKPPSSTERRSSPKTSICGSLPTLRICARSEPHCTTPARTSTSSRRRSTRRSRDGDSDSISCFRQKVSSRAT